MKYYIADTHFFPRRRTMDKDGRAFESVEEMHAYMIKKWNDKVSQDDEVYIIGDFSMGSAKETCTLARQLHGKKTLLIGNHDRYIEDSDFDADCFEEICSYKEIQDGECKVILCHYPVLFYHGQYKVDRDGNYTTYMLYGHVHNTPDSKLMDHFQEEIRSEVKFIKYTKKYQHTPCQMINCFCMFSDYEPLTLKEWRKLEDAKHE
ncbi:MAG: metallophosphoesterase family protein [Eubacterium sp.]|nr:metallophosphoesterase family protein [Eubacterium sp.]